MKLLKIKHWIIVINILLASTVSYAQKEGNIWYFGEYAGLDFNSGVPVALTDGAMGTNEGCSVISDDMGNLLFYTEGITVWNRNHVPMPNGFGLMGHWSSTQSALIVKKPQSNNIYYIFTTPAPYLNGGDRGFRYSTVDMSLNGGLGDVISKNVFLHDPVTEKLTAVRHANGCDIWVIAHEWRSNNFLAYLIGPSGVISTPVTSNIGTVHEGNSFNVIGQMKVSPDGSKLALALYADQIIELFDFDKATGLVSNPITFLLPLVPLPLVPPPSTYGVEFSPDGSRLYGTTKNGPDGFIYQWDLMAGSPSAIIGSRMLIGNSLGQSGIGSLQLGPDGKIYCALILYSFIGAINNPNALGAACNFVHDAVSLNGKRSIIGLPTFMQSHFHAQFSYAYANTCLGDSTFFSMTDTSNADSVAWIFGDTASGPFNTSADFNPFHIFNAPGTYTVQLIKYNGMCNLTFNQSVIIHSPLPQINLGNDTIICHMESGILDATVPGASYLWQDGSMDSVFTVSTPGLYWVEIRNNCGSSKDSIDIKMGTLPEVSLGNDILLCKGQSLVLDVTAPGASYLWQDGSADSIFTISSPGLYWVRLTNASGCSGSDSVAVESDRLEADFGYEAIPCTNKIQFINFSSDTSSSFWDFGDGTTSNENNPLHNYPNYEKYTVILITNPNSSCADTAQAVIPFEDDAKADILFIPNVFTPNGDGKNDFFEIKGMDNPCIDINRLTIFNRWGKKVFEAVESQFRWDGTTNEKRLADGVYFYVLEGDGFLKSGNVTLLR